MCEGAKPENLSAIIIAKAQAEGRDIFPEAMRHLEMGGSALYHYERIFADSFGVGNPKIKPQAEIQKDAKNPFHTSLYAHPSKRFSPKFYNPIDRRLSAWARKNSDRASYNEQVAKPMRRVLKIIDKAIKVADGDPKVLNERLRGIGLDADKVYEARNWAEWLANGGHLQKSKYIQPLIDVGSSIGKAQANLNMTWTLGNLTDMQRPLAHYLTTKGGAKAIIQGVGDLLRETKGNIFRRVPSLEKKGVYQTVYTDRGGANINPFDWSITAQKNLVWHVDKRAGGNGFNGIRDHIFDAKPWDRPKYDRPAESNLVFGLARYPLNEARWYFNKAKGALTGDMQAAAELAVFSLVRTVSTGTRSMVPFFVYRALDKETKQAMEDFDKEHNLNLIRQISGAAFESIGINASIDLTNYLQPFGGTLGARAGSLEGTATKTLASGAKAVSSLVQGDLPKASVNTLAGISALMNLGLGPFAANSLNPKLVPVVQAVGESNLNSTTVTKLLEVMAEELGKEFEMDRSGREVLKAVWGPWNIKKNKEEARKVSGFGSL